MGDAAIERGDAVVERGNGTETPGVGDAGWELASWNEWTLCGVECEVEEFGEGVLVRVSEGVRVFRERGLLRDTFRSFSNGDGYSREYVWDGGDCIGSHLPLVQTSDLWSSHISSSE